MERNRKLAIFTPFGEQDVSRIKAAAEGFEVIYAPDVDEAQQQKILVDTEICIGEPSWESIEKSTSLKLIQMTWAGTDKYTRAGRVFPSGIALCNASGAFGQIMSQYALGAVLSLYQLFPLYARQKEAHIWQQLDASRSIAGKTVLIFGAGNIGRATARLFRSLGALKITGVRRQSEVPPEFDEVCTLKEAACRLPSADIVIGCMPNTDDNQNYLDEAKLRSMKQDAVLVNMGRGAFVDIAALAGLLKEGYLFGAAIDVTVPEPLPGEHPLWDIPNLILTPHVAGPSFGNAYTESLIADICCENIAHYLTEETLKNRIY